MDLQLEDMAPQGARRQRRTKAARPPEHRSHSRHSVSEFLIARTAKVRTCGSAQFLRDSELDL
jgi:hypothetical protein